MIKIDKKVIAIIDSGVNLNQNLLKSIDIDSYVVKNGHIIDGSMYSSLHGTHIAGLICRECSYLKIISIKILNDKNRGRYEDLLIALKFCLDIKVDIINLSLGFTNIADFRTKELEDLCWEINSSGIAIFAADCNTQNTKSYPANFEYVISVGSDKMQNVSIRVNKVNRHITFLNNIVTLPTTQHMEVLKGNSYLTPIVVGMFVAFCKEENGEGIESFLDFLMREGKNSLFFTKNKECYDFLNNKSILFFQGYEYEINNKFIEKWIESYPVERCNLNEVNLIKESVYKRVNTYIVGNILENDLLVYRKELDYILKQALNFRKDIIMINPIWGIFRNMKMMNDYSNHIICLYK